MVGELARVPKAVRIRFGESHYSAERAVPVFLLLERPAGTAAHSRKARRQARQVLAGSRPRGIQLRIRHAGAESNRRNRSRKRTRSPEKPGMNTSSATTELATVKKVRVTDDALIVELRDGRAVSVPLHWYPRLAEGTAAERRRWELIGPGLGIHWPALDEDISVDGLLRGLPSGESPASLDRWRASRLRPANMALQPTSRVRRKAKSKRRSRAARG